MTDRQNREGVRFGGGGVATDGVSARQRRERLKQLALETFDISKDPYLVKNHIGALECALCSTVHATPGSYMAHTLGKRHKLNLIIRAERDAKAAAKRGTTTAASSGTTASISSKKPSKTAGRPGYKVMKLRNQSRNGLEFELEYPEIEAGLQPRYAFVSSYEQKIDLPPNPAYQYLVFAASPYENVGFKIPAQTPLDKASFTSSWVKETKKYRLKFYYV